jgi:hypothetical protein
MANETMTLIASTTISTATATIDFNSIPQTYTDLRIIYSARLSYDPYGVAVALVGLELNGGGSSVSTLALGGNGSSAYSETGSTSVCNSSNSTANTFGTGEINIFNYTSSAQKFISTHSTTENNATGSWQAFHSMRWPSTSAITSLKLIGSNFVANSSFALYGILKGSGGATVS